MSFLSSVGKDLPLLEENSDLSILSVRDSSSGHEIEQAQVATGFQAHLFESKFDTLTNSMLKMSDSLACLAPLLDRMELSYIPRKKMLFVKKVERVNSTPPNVFSRKKLTLNRANFLTRTYSRTRRTVDRSSMKASPSV